MTSGRCGAVKLGRFPFTSSLGNYCSGDKRRHLHCVRHTVTGRMTHHRKLRGEKPTTHSVRSVQVEKKDVKADFTVKSSDFMEPHEVQVSAKLAATWLFSLMFRHERVNTHAQICALLLSMTEICSLDLRYGTLCRILMVLQRIQAWSHY